MNMKDHKMKMSVTLYTDLKNDCETILKLGTFLNDVFKPDNISGLWRMFNVIMFQRNNDDTHPGFQNGTPRILPFWSRNGETQEIQGNDTWLNRFYVDEDLNDSHIQTALKKIAREINP